MYIVDPLERGSSQCDLNLPVGVVLHVFEVVVHVGDI